MSGANCFVAGTITETAFGPALIEGLRPGDPIRTAAGAARPIKWIGWRELDIARHPYPDQVRPVRFLAGALADGVPSRDLRVSPDHAMAIDGLLIPARLLLNGTTIRRDHQARNVTYYHIELDTHDLLVAEGAASESYLDTGNRGFFDNAEDPIVLHPDLSATLPRREIAGCLPFADDALRVEPVWRRLAQRAIALGHVPPPAQQTTTDPGLRVEVDGRLFDPVARDRDRLVFLLPAWRGPMRLLSRSAAPCDAQPWLEDQRKLGVMVRQITLATESETQAIPIDHPALTDGWWDAERETRKMWRWTRGDALIEIASSTACRVDVEIEATPAYPLHQPAQEDLALTA